MNIKIGDNVIVVSGSRKDKNKQGKVLKTFKDTNTLVVEGVNIKKKVTRDPNGKKRWWISNFLLMLQTL